MSLDAWGVKFKKKDIDYRKAWWNDVDEKIVRDILPKNNYFYEETFDEGHWAFIKNEVGIRMNGDPCCSVKEMQQASRQLKEWYKKSENKTYVKNNLEKDYEFSPKIIKDMIQYFDILARNDCVMWLSW